MTLATAMISEATRLARHAFELADSGRDAEAVVLYRQALSQADPAHADLWQVRGELASVFERIGDLAAAREQRELALEAALRNAMSEDSSEVGVARYFLGELLLKMGEPAMALFAIRPSLCASRIESPLRTVEAIAHWRLGSVPEATVAAKRAIESARNDDQRQRVAERLREILGNG